jgi:hypothetical protein
VGIVDQIAVQTITGAFDGEMLRQLETLFESYKGDRSHKVPLSLFSQTRLGVLECVVKFLRENQGMSYSDIALLLNRDDRTIWTTYRKAFQKHGERFAVQSGDRGVPCTIFLDRNLGPLEALTIYTKEMMNMSFNEISRRLNRDYRTVWISYQNGLKKRCLNA